MSVTAVKPYWSSARIAVTALSICAWLLTFGIMAWAGWSDYSKSLRHSGLSIDGRVLWGRDFVNVYTSGVLVLRDQVALIYDVARYRNFQSFLFGRGHISGHNYSYPPVSLLYTWAFALVPYPAALIAWLGLTGAAFVAAARPYLAGVNRAPWVAIILPASLINIWAGHYGFVVGALWLSAWSTLERRPKLAGVLFGLMIVKPHLAVLAPLALLWRREWTAFITAGITVVILVLASAALFGIDLWQTYLTVTTTYQAGLIDKTGTVFIRMMPTVVPALAMLGVPLGTALIVQGITGVGAIALLLRYLPADNMRAGLATGIATLLVLPYAFTYDMTVFSVAAFMILASASNRGSIGKALLGVLLFVTPAITATINRWEFTVVPLLIALALFVVLRSSSLAVPPSQQPEP